MLTTPLQWITGAAFLSSLFWCSARDGAVVLLVVWTIAVGIFVGSSLADRFLWIPVLLALAGVFGSVFVLAVPANLTLAANEVTLVLFMVSLEVLKKKRRSSTAFVRHRAW